MLDPITTTIDVPCSQRQAFEVFVHDMPVWWPLEKRSMSLMDTQQPSKALRVQATLGGTIVEVGADDREYHWGTFRAFDPHDYVRLDFHMGLPAENASTVEVRFTAVADDRTRVELIQSNWEAFGDLAEMMRGGYGSGWVIIFEQAYRSACGG